MPCAIEMEARDIATQVPLPVEVKPWYRIFSRTESMSTFFWSEKSYRFVVREQLFLVPEQAHLLFKWNTTNWGIMFRFVPTLLRLLPDMIPCILPPVLLIILAFVGCPDTRETPVPFDLRGRLKEALWNAIALESRCYEIDEDTGRRTDFRVAEIEWNHHELSTSHRPGRIKRFTPAGLPLEYDADFDKDSMFLPLWSLSVSFASTNTSFKTLLTSAHLPRSCMYLFWPPALSFATQDSEPLYVMLGGFTELALGAASVNFSS